MTNDGLRWVDAGNEAKGFFAVGNMASGFIVFGNVVTGVIAIGNVARGFIAIGNVAVGVIAIGNIGFGILAGAGATVGVGLVAAAGVVAFPVLDGFAGLVNLASVSPVFSIFPIGIWYLASRIFRGERAPIPPGPELVPLDALLRGEKDAGWVLFKRATPGDEGRAKLDEREVPATTEALASLAALGKRPRQVLAYLQVEEEILENDAGYRAPRERVRALRCFDLALAPRRPLPWTNSAEMTWWLARAWGLGSLLGCAALVLRTLGMLLLG